MRQVSILSIVKAAHELIVDLVNREIPVAAANANIVPVLAGFVTRVFTDLMVLCTYIICKYQNVESKQVLVRANS